MKRRSFGDEIEAVLALIGLIWLVFFADLFSHFSLVDWGIKPRTFEGLVGIVTAPFLHQGLYHLISNTVPLAILGFLLAGSGCDTRWVIGEIIILGDALLWMGGRAANHIGASCLVFGLISFLIFHGLFTKHPYSILISLLVGMFYGSTLVFGITPRLGSAVSWEGHLFGAIAGAAVAYWNAKPQRMLIRRSIGRKPRLE